MVETKQFLRTTSGQAVMEMSIRDVAIVLHVGQYKQIRYGAARHADGVMNV